MTHPLKRAREVFRDVFGEEPAGVARAPGRVNLIGEHTDYNDGWVFPLAVEQAAYLAFAPQAEPRLDIHAPDLDDSASLPLPLFSEEAPQQAVRYPIWLRYGAGVAWALGRSGRKITGLRGVLSSDIPMGAGLSSSAAVEAAFAIAFRHTGGWDATPMELAQRCQEAEHAFAGVRCGLMDQFATLHGVRGHALLFDCRTLEWRAAPIPAQAVLVVAHTRSTHKLESSAYNERRGQCEEAVRILARRNPGVRALRDATPEMLASSAAEMPPVVLHRAEHVIHECRRTLEAADALQAGDLPRMGALMNASHDSLRDLYEVSGPELNTMVSIARSLPGCYGARLTGAGFGGCTIQLVSSAAAAEFSAALAAQYAAKTGLQPIILSGQAAMGASLL